MIEIITKDNNTKHTLINSNFFDIGENIIGNVDMVLTDLPYGTTRAKWDCLVDLEGMWKWLHSYTTDRTPICLFAQTPFDKVLGASNIGKLKYEWIWEKGNATGHLNAKKMPMKAHENVLVFYNKLPTYNPQKTTGHPKKECSNFGESELYGKTKKRIYSSTERYPRDVLKFGNDKQKLNLHSTQKPIELLRYLIRSYTNEGDTILDITAGSFSMSVAAYLEGRNSICIEMDEGQYHKSVSWVRGCSFDNVYKVEGDFINGKSGH